MATDCTDCHRMEEGKVAADCTDWNRMEEGKMAADCTDWHRMGMKKKQSLVYDKNHIDSSLRSE